MPPVTDLTTLLRTMEPMLNPGTFVFATPPVGLAIDPAVIVASVREPEGLSVVLPVEEARRLGLQAHFRCAWITLTVNSSLDAVGLTAAFAGALGAAGISCNVVAGLHHDHIFVPVAEAGRALDELGRLANATTAVATPRARRRQSRAPRTTTIPANIETTKTAGAHAPLASDTKPGPGHTPERPQPTPKIADPRSSRESIALRASSANDPANSGARRRRARR